jgi:hypothetical protein
MRISHLHEHLDAALKRATRKPWVLVPSDTSYQPIAADDVAERLLDLCTPMQAHQLPDVAGPEIIDAADLTAFWLKATGKKRRLVVLKKPGGLYAGYREGWHLAPERSFGTQTFAEFVLETYNSDKAASDELSAKAEKPPKPEKVRKEKAPKDPDAPKEKRGWLGKVRDLDEESAGSGTAPASPDDATTT